MVLFVTKPLAFLLIALSLISEAEAGNDSYIVPPDEIVSEKTQADWSRDWWQWAGSFSRSESPIADTDGSLCGNGQSGPVWFLAGTYGTSRTERTCSIPSGKYIFFPLINYVVMPRSNTATCESVRATAHRITDNPAVLLTDIDGVQLDNPEAHRQATNECFNMGARAVPEKDIYPSAANGYYVMLRPLDAGMYELNFGGILPSMSQAVTYTLHVQ